MVKASRGGSGAKELDFEPIRMHINKMDISFATQLFIDGEFCNATSGKKSKSYNPHDESVICEVEAASVQDVDRAVKAANRAFHEGLESIQNLNLQICVPDGFTQLILKDSCVWDQRCTVPAPIKDAACFQKLFFQSTTMVHFIGFCAYEHTNSRNVIKMHLFLAIL